MASVTRAKKKRENQKKLGWEVERDQRIQNFVEHVQEGCQQPKANGKLPEGLKHGGGKITPSAM